MNCRFSIDDGRLPEKRNSKIEIRNSGAGGEILSLDFPVSIFRFRFSVFAGQSPIDNRQSAIVGFGSGGL